MAYVDCRGVKRGRCTDCTCDRYDGGSEKRKCVRCKHPPVKHMNLSQSSTQTGQSSASLTLSHGSGSSPSVYAQCLYSGCTEEAYCDLNTGDEKPYCKRHLTAAQQPTWPALTTAPTVYSNSISQQPGSRRSDGYIVPAHSSVQGILNLVQTPHTAIASTPLPSSGTATSSSTTSSSSAQQSSSRRSQSVSLPIARSSSSVVPTQCVNPVLPLPTTGQQQQQQQQRCMLPGCNQPVWVEPGKVHDFCRRSHAREFQNLRYHQNNGVAPLASASVPNLMAAGTGDDTCSLPGCNVPRYRDHTNGRVYDYCGRTHAAQARELGIQTTHPVHIRSARQQEFTQISRQFTNDWAKGTCPKVDFVFAISSTFLEQTWARYKASLADQTVEPHYHGTKLTCNITVTKTLCGGKNCGICGIACNGLDPSLIQQNISFQRFGRGFYLAPNSSKCHDYTQGCSAYGYRAMLLCDVCPGNKHYLLSDNVQLTGPPPGYDSVYGKVGGSLNYPEIVVYDPNAVMPRYIIVYQKNGTHKIAQ